MSCPNIEIEQTLFLGCSIVSFNVSAGLNEQSTELTVDLVKDPCPGQKVYWDSLLVKNTVNIADPGFIGELYDIIGVPAYFRFNDFEFCGIIQNWESTNEGDKYQVKLSSPTKILQDTQIILSDYAGKVTAQFGQVALSPYNIINVYGFRESIIGNGNSASAPEIVQDGSDGVYRPINQATLAGTDGTIFGSSAQGFGGSYKNNNGMLWSRIKESLNYLINSYPKQAGNLFSPYGRIVHKGINIGNNLSCGLLSFDFTQNIVENSAIVYNKPLNEYLIDISELPAVPNDYRFNQSSISILEIISQICEDTGHEFFIELLPTKYYFNQQQYQIIKFIKIRTINRTVTPKFGEIKLFVTDAQNSGIYKGSSYGRELKNDNTTKIIIGGNKESVYQAHQYINSNDNNIEDDIILPFFGTHPNGDMIVPYLDASGYWEFEYPTDSLEKSLELAGFVGNVAIINEKELQASADFSIWNTYIKQNQTDTWAATYLEPFTPASTGDIFVGNDTSKVPSGLSFENYLPYLINPSYSCQRATAYWSKSGSPTSEKETGTGAGDEKYRSMRQKYSDICASFLNYSGNELSEINRSARDFHVLTMSKKDLNEKVNYEAELNKILKDDSQKIFQFVSSLADEYYGKKFAVRVPNTSAFLDPTSNQIMYSEQPSQDGGWTEKPFVLGLPIGGVEIDVFRNQSNKIETFVAFTGQGKIDTSELNNDDYVTYNNNLYVRGNVDSEYVFHNVQTQQYPRAIVDIPSPVTLSIGSGLENFSRQQNLILGLSQMVAEGTDFQGQINDTPLFSGFRGSVDRGPVTGYGPGLTWKQKLELQLEYAYKGTAGKSIGGLRHPRAVFPSAAAFGIKSLVNTYGPWIEMGPPGGISIEKNEGLVPWEYGSYTNMNIAALELAKAAVTNAQATEQGTVEVFGFPNRPIFAEINRPFQNNYLVENRIASVSAFNNSDFLFFNNGFLNSGQFGPTITNVTIGISDSISTTYSFRTYTPRFGKFSHMNAERLKKNNMNRMQMIRDMRTYQTQQANSKNARNLSFKSTVAKTKRAFDKRMFVANRFKKLGTPHEFFVGSIFPFGIENNIRTIISNVSSNDLQDEIDQEHATKAISTFDSLIRPISLKGSGKLPRLILPLVSHTGNLQISQIDLNPYVNPTRIDPSGLLSRRYECKDSGNLGHDIDMIAKSNYISGNPKLGFNDNDGSDLSLWNRSPSVNHNTESGIIYDYKDDYRTFALRGPILLQSWGYDTKGYPVPNYVDKMSDTLTGYFQSTGLSGSFMSGWLRKSPSWPVAPIDLRLDRNRGVWVGSSTTVDTVLITGNVQPANWDSSEKRLTRRSVKCLRLIESDSGMIYSDTITVYNPFATTISVAANKARIATVINDVLMNIDCNEITFTGI